MVALACRKPAELGLPRVRWTCRSLTAQLLDDGVFTSIHYTTIHLLLEQADLHPHRLLYWKRSHDPDFVAKAVHVLWYYQMARTLRQGGEWVFCLDEKTQIQLLGRKQPDIPMRPGCPRRREHEYVRHGTGNLILIHDVVEGTLFADTPAYNRSGPLTDALEQHLALYPQAQKLHYILDNGPTHDSAHTRRWRAGHGGRVRFHFTPIGASWLNQGELALSAFSRRYLRDRAWDDHRQFSPHVQNSVQYHNRHDACPFDWSFTRNRFREWNRCRTSSTGH